MRALVTGAGGFIGAALARRLLARGDVERLTLFDRRLDAAPSDARVRALPGDICDAALRRDALADGIDTVFHLAGVLGGQAEQDPNLSRAVNIDASLSLFEAAAGARVVYASTIAVFASPLPDVVIDTPPLAPALTYGAHKLMMEIALRDLHRRGALSGVALRLPGVVARPSGDSHLKSAFMSEIFHALAERRPFVCPVSAAATVWLSSVDACVDNLLHAAVMPAPADGAAFTQPALRVSLGDLAAAICAATGASPDLVAYDPDPALEALFGAYPPLRTPRADAAGFAHDGDLDRLVRRALAGARPDLALTVA